MTNIQRLAERLKEDTPLRQDEMLFWAQGSEFSHARSFYGSDLEDARRSVRSVAEVLITRYMNNPNTEEVPLDQKTRSCVILNNIALYKPVRSCIFDMLDKLGEIFEESIKLDALMPFNPDLGRMTEHVSVLLMRVTGYKLKAANVLEFTDGNMQFSLQLMLAVLLKVPPYEPALRCNCITIILGFTQPQAFFDSSSGVEETSCEQFTEKIDFMLKMMLRLKAVQVISDVLTELLDGTQEMSPVLHITTCSAMRCIMNIFRFSSTGSTQWRQHVLLSTTLLDHSVTMYLHMQCESLQKALSLKRPAVNIEMLRGMSLGFKFASLCTFRLGRHAREARLFFPYLHDMLQLSLRPVMHDVAVSRTIMRMYVDMFHFMVNIDALGGDRSTPAEEILPQLRSDSLKKSVEAFVLRNVASGGRACVQEWQSTLKTVEPDTLVERGSSSFVVLQKILASVEAQCVTAPAPVSEPLVPAVPVVREEKRLINEMLQMRSTVAEKKISIENAAAPMDAKQQINLVGRDAIEGVDPALLCALTGNVMKKPVLSPYGHTFDQECILAWLQHNGSVCPITGKPLTAENLQPNKSAMSLIMKHVIQQSMLARNQENEADLYDF